MEAESRGVTRKSARLAILLFGAARLILGASLGFRPFDDTYITFRYALNIGDGLGFVYNLGEHVLGTTSPLWAVSLALLHRMHVALEPGSLFVALAVDIGSSLLLFELMSSLEYDVAVCLAGSILFLSIFDGISLSRSGMETSAFVFLVLAALAAISTDRLALAGVFSALSCLTRPEGILLVGVLACALVAQRLAFRRAGLISFAPVVSILGAWFLYATATFASVVPQSVVAKAAGAHRADLSAFSWTNLALFFLKGQYGGAVYSRTYWQLTPVMTAVAGIGFFVLARAALSSHARRDVLRAVLIGLFPLSFVGALAAAHAFTWFPWYYGPTYPFLAALAMIGAASIFRRRPPAIAALCGVLVAAQAIAALRVKLPADHDFWVAGYLEASSRIPKSPATTVAAPEIGAVGWTVWPTTVLDLVGLVTPDAIRMPAEDFLRLKKPDYLVLRTDDAAALLARLDAGHWFAQDYELVFTRRDPYEAREFRTYRKR
jgi:hypothetical protein